MKIISLINKSPNHFCVIQALARFYGSVVYRAIAGSSKEYVWTTNMAGSVSQEDLNPLEWPHKTEGYGIYPTWTTQKFVDQHLLTAHISISLLEKIPAYELKSRLKKGKTLLLKSHNMELDDLICKKVRVVGDIREITDFKGRPCYWRVRGQTVEPVDKHNVHNLNIQNFMSLDFSAFLEEYIKLIQFLEIQPNINNVRQYILLSKDKMTRYNDLFENN